jgi:hypothetical protein
MLAASGTIYLHSACFDRHSRTVHTCAYLPTFGSLPEARVRPLPKGLGCQAHAAALELTLVPGAS